MMMMKVFILKLVYVCLGLYVVKKFNINIIDWNYLMEIVIFNYEFNGFFFFKDVVVINMYSYFKGFVL